MEEVKLLEELFDEKLIRIMRLFFQDSARKMYLKEVSDQARVSMATTHRFLQKLVRLAILNEIKISKFKVYQLADNERTEFLASFIKQSIKVLEIFVDKVKQIKGVEMIILHGKDTENRANLLIIGSGIESEKVKEAAVDIKEKHNFMISYLTLEKSQFEQMSEMGLYSGKKKILFGV